MNRRRQTLQEKSSSQPGMSSPGWRLALYFLAGGVAILGISFLVLNQVYSDPSLSGEAKLSLVFVLLFFVLGFSVGGLGYVIRISLQRSNANPILVALLMAYGLPLAVFLVLSGILASLPGPIPGALQNFALFSDLYSGQPWLFIWQAIILAFFSRLPERSAEGRVPLLKTPYLPASLLSGIFIGLIAAFSFSLGAGILENSPTGQTLASSLDMPLVVRLITLAIALVVAPWAEERFFRGEILSRWQPRLSRVWAFLAVAVLYATLQFRPLLWAPAFLASLGFSYLAERTGQVRTAIIAHAVVNLILFLIGWYLVI